MASPDPNSLISMALDILDLQDRGEAVEASLRRRYSRLLGEIAHTGRSRRLFRRVLFEVGAPHMNRLDDLIELFDQDLADVISDAEAAQHTARQSAQRCQVIMAGSGGTTLTSGVGVAAVLLGATAASLVVPVLLLGFCGGSVLFAYSYDKHRRAGDLEKDNARAAMDARELRALIKVLDPDER